MAVARYQNCAPWAIFLLPLSESTWYLSVNVPQDLADWTEQGKSATKEKWDYTVDGSQQFLPVCVMVTASSFLSANGRPVILHLAEPPPHISKPALYFTAASELNLSWCSYIWMGKESIGRQQPGSESLLCALLLRCNDRQDSKRFWFLVGSSPPKILVTQSAQT